MREWRPYSHGLAFSSASNLAWTTEFRVERTNTSVAIHRRLLSCVMLLPFPCLAIDPAEKGGGREGAGGGGFGAPKSP